MLDTVAWTRGTTDPRPRPFGISAVLLPCTAAGAIDWEGFARHVARTAAAGVVPAVNMDTGSVQLLDRPARREVVRLAREVVGDGPLVAGACVVDTAGDACDEAAYREEIAAIEAAAAVPVIFPSHGLNAGDETEVIARLRRITAGVPRFIGFELSPRFVPCGRIFSVSGFASLLDIPGCVGAKHSSLSRRAERERLALRDRLRPGFRLFTGNDLAIDMIRAGSDWLLGLSTAAPEAFALRDRWWTAGDDRADELDDALQALGDFAFRDPVPAYKHSLAQMLRLRGWIACDAPPAGAPRRPDSDREILRTILARIEAAVAQ